MRKQLTRVSVTRLSVSKLILVLTDFNMWNNVNLGSWQNNTKLILMDQLFNGIFNLNQFGSHKKNI